MSKSIDNETIEKNKEYVLNFFTDYCIKHHIVPPLEIHVSPSILGLNNDPEDVEPENVEPKKVRKQRPRMTKREYNQRYTSKHREEINKQKKDYYRRNKDKICENAKTKRGKKLCD